MFRDPRDGAFHRRIVLVSAVFMLAAPMPVHAAGPPVSDYRLANGLELVVIPDHRAPVVTHMIWYKVGAADETPGKSGLAHFLEHLMFKGTAKHPAGQFSTVVAAFGGRENAFTGADYTGYFQRVPSEKLKTVMEFEADRMNGLALSEDDVLRERDVILEEESQRIGNNPRARLGVQIDAALFLNSPYGKPVIGWRHEMAQLTRDDAVGFYRRFYGPNDAIVVVAGDVEPEQALAFAQETYGKVKPNNNIAPRRRPKEPPPVAARRLSLADPRVEQPIMERAYLVPSFATAAQGESEALEVLAHVVGAGTNSRLYRELVIDRQVAVAASAWYDSLALDMSKFGIYAAPRGGVSLPDLETALDAVLTQVKDKGITAEELDRSKNKLIADAVYAHDSQVSMARWYGSALTTGATVDDIARWPDRIRAVTGEQVRAVARRWLDLRRSVTGYLVKDDRPPVEKRL